MRKLGILALVPAVALAAACSKEQPKLDDALARDLDLAASVQPAAQQYISPVEMGYGQQYAPVYPQANARHPQYPAQPTPVVYRAPAPAPAPAPARTSSSSGRIYRAPSPAPAPAPVRHTTRDAAIGAAAGAITGAVVSRNTKGALIGAAAGGILGAVVGHTVDVDHR